MSKEYIQALNGLFDLVRCQDSFEKAQKYFDIVEEGLQRLEAIDNAEPSEALECLEKVYSRLPQWDLSRNVDQCNTIKQALIKTEKEHKVLEIIKENPKNGGLCINYLKINKYYPNMQDYKHYCMTIREFYRVNEETFNILKEWILND